jgi:hypothetical protein
MRSAKSGWSARSQTRVMSVRNRATGLAMKFQTEFQPPIRCPDRSPVGRPVDGKAKSSPQPSPQPPPQPVAAMAAAEVGFDGVAVGLLAAAFSGFLMMMPLSCSGRVSGVTSTWHSRERRLGRIRKKLAAKDTSIANVRSSAASKGWLSEGGPIQFARRCARVMRALSVRPEGCGITFLFALKAGT